VLAGALLAPREGGAEGLVRGALLAGVIRVSLVPSVMSFRRMPCEETSKIPFVGPLIWVLTSLSKPVIPTVFD
jgi:hypothetical protein